MNEQSSFWRGVQEFFRILFRRFESLGAQIHTRRGRYLVVGLPLLWYGLFFAIPLAIVLKISFARSELAQPPYQDLVQKPDADTTVITLYSGNYRLLFDDLRGYFGWRPDPEAAQAIASKPDEVSDSAPGAQQVGEALMPSDSGFTSFESPDPLTEDDSADKPPSESGFLSTEPSNETGLESAEPHSESGFVSAEPQDSSLADSSAGFAVVGGEDERESLPIETGAATLMQESVYAPAFVNSLRIAFFSTLLCLLIGYPMAYLIAKSAPRQRALLLLLVVLPFWTSSLLRTYAWLGLLKDTGPINNLLLWVGVIDAPIRMLDTEFAVYLCMVYNYLPFMVLPLVANLVKLDPVLLQAAADLGAKPWRAFLAVTLPLSIPGIIAGCMLVFIPCVGEFVIPDLLGGGRVPTIGMTLWNEFFKNTDWPLASAIAICMLMLIVLPLVLFEYVQSTKLNPARRV
jgi:putrescine transport system permease protein